LFLDDEDATVTLNAASLAGELEHEIDKYENSSPAGELEHEIDKRENSIVELVESYGSEYHRNTSDIEYAAAALRFIRGNPLEKIRDGLLRARLHKKIAKRRAFPIPE
jgi:hypothetical protein